MTIRAMFETRNAWLGTEFGESYARRLFGDETVDALPRYVRGKNVGKFKVSIHWVKCTQGGWVRTGAMSYDGFANGFVENRRGSVVCAVLRAGDDVLAIHGDNKYHFLGFV